ncbi:MAG: hypothetical protein ACYDHX_16440 [Methanothrix sp.]
MDEIVAGGEQTQIKFVSKKSPEYKLEFINGAMCNLTTRGDIVCDLHFESRDRPTEQIATIVGDGAAKILPFQEKAAFTRDVKFGIIMNAQFAKDLVEILVQKIKESEEVIAERAKVTRANINEHV